VAEGTCTAALALDPGSTKARYRRALARHRLGRHSDAAADIAAFPVQDAAVAALRAQVEAALQGPAQRG
jgi:hypothetical protein